MALRVLHFVTGGFSGATQVAIDLVGAHNSMADMVCLLVLRQKKTTTATHLQQLQQSGIPYHLVSGAMHWLTIYQLMKLCTTWKPDILVAHGFPEHLLGRWAGLWAKVPHLVQVEHSTKERYTRWRLWQSRYLSARSSCVIGVSQGVLQTLATQQLRAPKIVAVPNGIETEKYLSQDAVHLSKRPNDLIMVARFAKDKDHATVVQAMAYLKQWKIDTRLMLVGGGKQRYQQAIKQLAQAQGVAEQIDFAGRSNQVAALLAQNKIFVLSSLREGLSLSVLEAMAAGCVVVASRTHGISELIIDGVDGFLFDEHDAQGLAKILKTILQAPDQFNALAERGRAKVAQYYDKEHMAQAYADLLRSLVLSCDDLKR
ncbi:glycosyltransferase [Paralysiella testudinis]|uniref:Glycosyltransferase n=1 Tax=Paralysiella testudinis TaxID=2809020 RepID=A0A892ZHZ9_9NEIS|nr:glycosyltransferase [Paralysiella testudinis]QRQ82120.1 glycosyltransferase [Paralysiella testudinis]